jgi:hypothetical protein
MRSPFEKKTKIEEIIFGSKSLDQKHENVRKISYGTTEQGQKYSRYIISSVIRQ